MMQPKTYTDITPDKFVKIQLAAKAASGLDLVGYSGTATGHSVTVAWNYDGVSNLTMQCTHKPFIISDSFVQNHLDSLVNEA